jgi:hypothetical protein
MSHLQKSAIAQALKVQPAPYKVPFFAQKHNLRMCDALKIVKVAGPNRALADRLAERIKQQMG